METQTAKSRVTRVRQEPRRRELEVVSVETVGRNFRSVTFSGDALEDFVSQSFDDHVKLIFTSADGAEIKRDYTPRRFNAARRELTIEFALHGDGFASNWAATAEPGQRIAIAGPRGSFIVPTDYAWHLFVGDATALPAIARRMEELPEDAIAMVIVQIDDPADKRRFKSKSLFNAVWTREADELLREVESLHLPSGDGYVWCAAEAGVATRVREILVDQKGHDKHAIRASAYWKHGASAHHEKLGEA
jgi:NADPH-dependent ferric siderophore reductase